MTIAAESTPATDALRRERDAAQRRAERLSHELERIRRTLDSTQLLYETSRRISTAMSVDEVITAYLEQVAAGGRYHSTVSLYETDSRGRRTALACRMRWSPSGGLERFDLRIPYDALAGIIDTLDAGDTVTIPDITIAGQVSEVVRRL
ncbi:MAG: hypothetical protein AB7R89_20755 [Dehalococcoidia bacterium]